MNAGDTAGVRVVVHSATYMPFPEDEGVTVSPGHSTSIGLQMVSNNKSRSGGGEGRGGRQGVVA